MKKNLCYYAACMLAIVQLASCSKNQTVQSNAQNDAATVMSNPQNHAESTLLPKDILNLGPWTLTLPIDNSGSNTGAAITVDSTTLKNGYTSQWLYTSADSGVTFWCPTDGATTTPGTGSDHPRTELHENRLWTVAEKGKLQATLIINQYPPDTPSMTIGQIHGGGTWGSVPFVLLHIKSGTIYGTVYQALTGSADSLHTFIKNVALSSKIYYSIYTNGATVYFNIIVTPVSGSPTTLTWNTPVPAAFKGSVLVHFSAGDYITRHNPGDGLFPNSTIGGKLTMYSLAITHY
ncbi:hypothetical protein BEL04_17430 [Mucilaginibacter sp. PPCGB 2223]|nr:hypothetical protein BEL04_17430 [Mucilaginibacter sp. PPCGB 2223]